MGSLSMGFSRQGYWSGLPFPSPEDLPNPEIEPGSPTLQADASLSEPPAITKWSHNLRQDIFRFLGLFSHWDNEGNWNPNSGPPFSAEPLWFSPAARGSRIVIHQGNGHSNSCQSAESHPKPDCSTETDNVSNFPRPYLYSSQRRVRKCILLGKATRSHHREQKGRQEFPYIVSYNTKFSQLVKFINANFKFMMKRNKEINIWARRELGWANSEITRIINCYISSKES